ncbi:MAG: hypothetical protein HJJLKODD_00375 [Phycisphaerae bacterium]|nr:hypothetical protein [Phycisphaerae bacterium]
MQRRTIIILGLGLFLWTGAASIPTPNKAPQSWELKFTFSDPERITLTLPGDHHPTTYWYIRYNVENDSGSDIQFFPAAELVSDSLEVVLAGEQISPTVYDAIRQKHKTTDPFMVDPGQILGTLLQGEDNQKSSIFVFRQFNLQDNSFSIFISGLSGEIKRIQNPSFVASQPDSETNPRLFTLRKTLEVKYQLPGDPRTREEIHPVRISREWVMR